MKEQLTLVMTRIASQQHQARMTRPLKSHTNTKRTPGLAAFCRHLVRNKPSAIIHHFQGDVDDDLWKRKQHAQQAHLDLMHMLRAEVSLKGQGIFRAQAK